jgi:hypothetical protein
MHQLLADHTCATVQAQGWAGIKNGELLERAEAHFDLFVTSDQNIRYQQNLSGRAIGILELSTNDLHRIQSAAALIHGAIDSMRPGDFKRLVIPEDQ